MKKYILLLLTISFIICLNKNWAVLPPLGKFLDPYHGCWQNASKETEKQVIFNMKELTKNVEVRFDERLVPHIFADNNLDAIFIQGYLHAKFRLWQMDMTSRLAGGRLSEVAGEKTLKSDREMRRKGMVFGAENSLTAIEKDPQSKAILEKYRDGVNYYIHSLSYKNFPLEYKLMNFEPEDWTNLKTCLMMKFMADKLSGHTEDFELTTAKKIFGNLFDTLYPEHLDEEYPVIQTKQTFQKNKDVSVNISREELQRTNEMQSITPRKFPASEREDRESDKGIGSNNWALSGTQTQSGKTMLCNDPHLPLNLPSIWYENQIITPTMNVYGVSLPGAPQVVIGFNDSIAWGFTNGYRDVKDFYAVQFSDESRKAILMDGKKSTTSERIETIHIKGNKDYIDTVIYCLYGPVMYDRTFLKKGFEQQNFAVKWMAHRGTNELKALADLNTARNYNDYVEALQYFQCPHQNFVFASASGDIAMWSQGTFIHKKEEQGRFIEDGTKSENNWSSDIPYQENPHEINPERGFVVSANQVNTSKDYPYYYNGMFTEERAKRLTNLLSEHKKYTVEDMMKIQNDLYNQDAADILPILLNHLDTLKLSVHEKNSYNELRGWNYFAQAESKACVMYDIWFSQFEADIYDDELGDLKDLVDYPKKRVTLMLLKNYQVCPIFDDINTPLKENVSDIVTTSFHKMCETYTHEKNKLWYTYKHTTAEHLAKIPAFSVSNIKIGGGHGIVNAASSHDGPSWRMIVHFTNPIEAYGIYHGGESGNVASPYYTNMLQDWANGKYYRLQFAHKPNDVK